ncbi:hypothetical protein M5K25_016722 [Dendrobium thyrsiflorum]|uniref:SKP1-like protein n=1 Tax=Dendrobium thyrsiflorum TaxID=117978 RepID=A0ABD0UKV6_DENTH
MMVTLRSSDGVEFVVEEAVARESQTILNLIEDGCANDVIPVLIVNSNILAKVIEYCTEHAKHVSNLPFDNYISELILKKWDKDFLQVDQSTLFDLILAANYLNIKGLLDLSCQAVADMIKGETPEVIRRTFNIRDDFTPEEEEEVRRANPWAFE